MNLFRPFTQRFPNWADWIALIFLAVMAPLIAACIQSVSVFRRDHWIYQALIGGAYFHEVQNPRLATIVQVIFYCGIFAIPTFLVLLPFRKRAFYRWLVWIGSIAISTWFYISTQNSYVIK
jgi:hypothetical protein